MNCIMETSIVVAACISIPYPHEKNTPSETVKYTSIMTLEFAPSSLPI